MRIHQSRISAFSPPSNPPDFMWPTSTLGDYEVEELEPEELERIIPGMDVFEYPEIGDVGISKGGTSETTPSQESLPIHLSSETTKSRSSEKAI